ncbi:hypothetical protein GWI33_009470 [Rhynchophorus ferrugineus]|uniref:Uncharacterized protein n=1 Tax=Rhynchophorus ferrugineus TaxID=354439 RepID=A0A834IN66_RHYFE|nr:hypothetical protein GWI33_009470 [Rhynchophorus ferrugineus]
MFQNSLHLVAHRSKMLKSLNNPQNPFSMDNLLAGGKSSPEIDLERQEELGDRGGYSPSFAKHEDDLSDHVSEGQLSPNDRSGGDLLSRFSCLRGRLCSNCGRLDCNYLHCRLNSENLIKETKPVLKFSVSAILGDEKRDGQKTGGKWSIIIGYNHPVTYEVYNLSI